MKTQVYRYRISQEVPEPISTALALGISAIAMWFTGELVSLINPWSAIGYYVTAILLLIGMILYPVLYFVRY